MKKFRFLYIAAAALLFAACANEEDGIGNNGPVAATVFFVSASCKQQCCGSDV